MRGSSYAGNTQLLAAIANPPALKCIMPTAFVGDFLKSFPFSGGVPNKGPYMQWHQLLDVTTWDDRDVACCNMSALDHARWGPALRKRPLLEAADGVLEGDKLENWRNTMSWPLDNKTWQTICFTDKELASLDIPMLITDGWYDMTIGPIDLFSRMEKIQPNKIHRYLLVGPWDHYQTATLSIDGDNNGDRVLPKDGGSDPTAIAVNFFDRYLKDNLENQEQVVEAQRVRVYITGASNSNANRWINLTSFPAPSTFYKELYLHSDGDAVSFSGSGLLSSMAPVMEEPVDNYIYDPMSPTASQVETFADRRDVEMRSDVLTYTTEPFRNPLTILGDISLILHAASDCPDTDWFAILSEVFPCGESRSFHYAPPAVRARYREGFEKEVFLTPNKPEKFLIPMGPAGHQIPPGNRLRLSIFSAAFPEYDPNSNTGNEVATDTQLRIAQQTIYHDKFRASHIVLPVIDLDVF